jgi:hypothetical protein
MEIHHKHTHRFCKNSLYVNSYAENLEVMSDKFSVVGIKHVEKQGMKM